MKQQPIWPKRLAPKPYPLAGEDELWSCDESDDGPDADELLVRGPAIGEVDTNARLLVAVCPHQRARVRSLANLQLHDRQLDRRKSPPAHILVPLRLLAAVPVVPASSSAGGRCPEC